MDVGRDLVEPGGARQAGDLQLTHRKGTKFRTVFRERVDYRKIENC